VEAIRAAGELVRIPMSEEHVRSLNLSVSVGIGLFESLRQLESRRTPHEGEQQHQDSGTQTVGSKVAAH
jgi:tRNA (cytidine/uridine-2'-O-)-methyltransferase